VNGRVVMRRHVLDDIHKIIAFLEQHTFAAADRFAEFIFPTLEDLALMPGKGSLKQFRSLALQGIRS
jgi:hypothetical protein